MTDIQPTPASSWKRSADKTTAVVLPSGNTAVLRDEVRMKALVRSGILEKQHLDAIVQMQAGALDDPAVAIELQDVLVSEMFVSPRVVLTADDLKGADNAILIDELSDEDLDHVVSLLNTGMAADATFPDERGSADPGPDSGEVAEKPKRVSRSRSRKSKSVSS